MKRRINCVMSVWLSLIADNDVCEGSPVETRRCQLALLAMAHTLFVSLMRHFREKTEWPPGTWSVITGKFPSSFALWEGREKKNGMWMNETAVFFQRSLGTACQLTALFWWFIFQRNACLVALGVAAADAGRGTALSFHRILHGSRGLVAELWPLGACVDAGCYLVFNP